MAIEDFTYCSDEDEDEDEDDQRPASPFHVGDWVHWAPDAWDGWQRDHQERLVVGVVWRGEYPEPTYEIRASSAQCGYAWVDSAGGASAFELVRRRTVASVLLAYRVAAYQRWREQWYVALSRLEGVWRAVTAWWRRNHPPFYPGDLVTPTFLDEDDPDDGARLIVRKVEWHADHHDFWVWCAHPGAHDVSSTGVPESFRLLEASEMRAVTQPRLPWTVFPLTLTLGRLTLIVRIQPWVARVTRLVHPRSRRSRATRRDTTRKREQEPH